LILTDEQRSEILEDIANHISLTLNALNQRKTRFILVSVCGDEVGELSAVGNANTDETKAMLAAAMRRFDKTVETTEH